MDHGAFPLWVIRMQFPLYGSLFISGASLSWSFQLKVIIRSDLCLQETTSFELHLVYMINLQLNHSSIFVAGTIFAYGVTSSGKTHTMHVRSHLKIFLPSSCLSFIGRDHMYFALEKS